MVSIGGGGFFSQPPILKILYPSIFYDDVDIRLLATWGWIVGLLWLGRRIPQFHQPIFNAR